LKSLLNLFHQGSVFSFRIFKGMVIP
jgi:hypothetical protein